MLSVYADLDTECLRPYDTVFAKYNISTVSHTEATTASEPEKKDKTTDKPHKKKGGTRLSTKRPSYAKAERKVFLGRMGTDEGFSQSLPNAWMASTPGHPFWVLPLESCAEHINSGWTPEGLTGPGALFDQVKVFQEEFDDGKGTKLDEHYAKSGWRHLYKQSTEKTLAPPPQFVEILPFWEIYPYSWERDGQMYRDVCWVSEPTFNAKKCKLLLGLDHWESHSITYWSHSWSASGHWDAHVEILNKPNKKGAGEKGEKVGDASEENRRLEEEKEMEEHEEEHEPDERSLESASAARRRRRSLEAKGQRG